MDRANYIVRLAQAGVPSAEVVELAAQHYPPRITLRWVQRIASEAGFGFQGPAQELDLVDEGYLDIIVAFCFLTSGQHYGYRLIRPDVEELLPPGKRVSRRQLLDSMRRVGPASHQVRTEQAWRKLTRRTVYATYASFRWELDYNERLAFVGIHIGGLWDSCTREWLRLHAVDNKLAVTQWEQVVRPVVELRGFCDQLNTDKGDENRLTAFAWRASAADNGRLLPAQQVGGPGVWVWGGSLSWP